MKTSKTKRKNTMNVQTDTSSHVTKPMAHFPHTKNEGKNIVTISGQGHRIPDPTDIYRGISGTKENRIYDVKEAVIGVFCNLKNALESEGLDLSHLTSIEVLMIRKSDFTQMNEVWNAIFPDGKLAPTRTTSGRSWLPGENIIEMSARASRKVNPPNKVDETILKGI
jgi:enamine deaminase RidA (YjgF/YER057c/UK114 family)